MGDQEKVIPIEEEARHIAAKAIYEYQEDSDSIPWEALAWPEAGYKIGAYEAADCVLGDLREEGIEFHRGVSREVAESISSVSLIAEGLSQMMSGALIMAMAERLGWSDSRRRAEEIIAIEIVGDMLGIDVQEMREAARKIADSSS